MAMRSVAWRLITAFLLVAIVAVGIVAISANRATEADFQDYVERGGRFHLESIADGVGGQYEKTGQWTDVSAMLENYKRYSSERLILADANGTIVADTAGALLGQNISQSGLTDGYSVVANGKQVAKVYSSVGNGLPIGRVQDSRNGMGTTMSANQQSILASAEQNFLDNVNQSLLMAALGAALVAIALGLFLTYQIVRPLRALTRGAQKIARGDLTSRVQVHSRDELEDLAAAFNVMADNLETNERLRRGMLADVAHELRTPLSIIEGTADGILDGVFEPTTENIAAIKEESRTLARLVSDLRQLALAEAGELRLDRDVTNIANLVCRATRRWEKTAQEKGVELLATVPEGLPEVEIDEERISQVIGNLVKNALGHIKPGGNVSVRVTLQNAEVVIAVADNGEGIAAEDLPFVFERFYRGDKSRTRRSGGTGLGLAIVKQLVLAHGGRVWAESTIGLGSTFYVGLPFRAP